jgi:MFS transporter, SP family, sugar:H+ symporter
MKVNLMFIMRIVAVATIGGFMFGYDSGVINGTQEGLEQAFGLSKLGVGINVGSILIGCAVGAFMAGRLADVIGRRNVMLLAAVAFIISALGSGAAHASIPFILARLIGGLGVGAASVLAPAYISEVTPASIRGRLSSVQQVMIITGLTAAFLANYVLAGVAGLSTAPLWHGFEAWRWMFWMQVIPATFYLLTLLFIPESPRYLVSRGRIADAQAVLTRLFGADEAEEKVREIRASLTTDHRPKLADLKNPSTGRWRRIVWVGIGLAVFQQLVGINVVFYYGAVLWQSVGFTESDALRINVLTGSLSILACLATVSLVDKVGRRPLLLIGSAGMAITLGIMVLCFTSGTFHGGALQLTPGTGKIALVSAIAYTMLFNLSWGPVMWVMLGEMFPNQIRGSALAVAGFAQWFANFLVSVSFPWLAANVGLSLTYSFYALSALVSFFFVRAMVQETRGRELEQMTG